MFICNFARAANALLEVAMLADGCFFWVIIAVGVGVALSWGSSSSPRGCPRCGASNRRIARFCSRCGARLR